MSWYKIVGNCSSSQFHVNILYFCVGLAFRRSRNSQSGQMPDSSMRRGKHSKHSNVSAIDLFVILISYHSFIYLCISQFIQSQRSKSRHNSQHSSDTRCAFIESEQSQQPIEQLEMAQHAIPLSQQQILPIYSASQIIDPVCPQSYVAAIPMQPMFSTTFPTSSTAISTLQVIFWCRPNTLWLWCEFNHTNIIPIYVGTTWHGATRTSRSKSSWIELNGGHHARSHPAAFATPTWRITEHDRTSAGGIAPCFRATNNGTLRPSAAMGKRIATTQRHRPRLHANLFDGHIAAAEQFARC